MDKTYLCDRLLYAAHVKDVPEKLLDLCAAKDWNKSKDLQFFCVTWILVCSSLWMFPMFPSPARDFSLCFKYRGLSNPKQASTEKLPPFERCERYRPADWHIVSSGKAQSAQCLPGRPLLEAQQLE